jgi:hypothetical protein
LTGDGESLRAPDYGGDRVRVSNYDFRPGTARAIVTSGLVRNLSPDTIEIRGYRIEYLTPEGTVAGAHACYVRMGHEHCGLGTVNIRWPGYIALHNDTLPPGPVSARIDTARVFWSYCVR